MTAAFEPIAIVGSSCVLPGAHTPAELWRNVAEGRDLVTSEPPGRWRVDSKRLLHTRADGVWSDRGGYVNGFRFDAEGFDVPAAEVARLDPLFHWVLHGTREALRAAGRQRGGARSGIVLGNLSYPSEDLVRLAEKEWLGAPAPGLDPKSRFMSGYPALLAAKALGLEGGGAFALDAACASSIYAIKAACDKLHDGDADLMVAGAVNRAESLMLHAGFSALQALSKTGQTRPFHKDADGLIPCEGAAFVVLRRLEDARRAGEKILGVIRGIGVSNDGRTGSFVSPSEEGQARAIAQAYQRAGLAPSDISLLECHATGTKVGDATEIRSTARVFQGVRDLPIGSLKSNLGHLITAAGVAGLLKVLGAIAHRTRPPTLHVEQPLEALAGSPFRLLRRAEAWDVAGPRRAAVSAFGFGGNNAHLIVEEHDARTAATAAPRRRPVEIAVVGLGARVGAGESAEDFARALLGAEAPARAATGVSLPVGEVRTPPQDLKKALGQQLLVLDAALEATRALGKLPREKTGVFVGMGTDPDAARASSRLRLAEAERDAVQGPCDAAIVLGTMPNVPANRVSSVLDAAGAGFTVSAEELSGMAALELGLRALRSGELDTVVVGAVDLSCEPVHAAAARAVLPADRQIPGDAAVVLVLERLEDARARGRTIRAVIGSGAAPRLADLTARLGHAHAASGLLHVAAAVVAGERRALPAPTGAAAPWLPEAAPRALEIEATSFAGASSRVTVKAGASVPFLSGPAPRLSVFSGADRAEVRRNVEAGVEGDAGPARLVIVDTGVDRRPVALEFLAGKRPAPEGVFFRERPLGGELGFVFTMAATAYGGMGRELFLALPELGDRLYQRYTSMREAAGWVYSGARSAPDLHAELCGYALLSQLHVELTRGVLGLAPQAAIGLCTGESSSLFAMGAWRDMDDMFAEIGRSDLYTRDLAGDFEVAKRAWAKRGVTGPVEWATWRVLAPVAEVRAAAAGEPLAHVTIVHTANDCLLGGQRAATERVVDKIGRARARHLGPGMLLHCAEAEEYAAEWRAMHHRTTHPVPGVRFYTHSTGTHYAPTADSAADAILGHALHTIELPQVIENAYADGVRVFLEHGPRDLCTGWIRQILGDREHVAVSLDQPGKDSLVAAFYAVAQLMAAGVPVDHRALAARLPAPAAPAPAGMRYAARAPAIHLPARETMQPQQPKAPQPPAARAKTRARSVTPVGPTFSRADLEVLASGDISSRFGPLFQQQDGFRRQVRMPMPPLLLADRVTGIDAEPGTMGTGTIWTETDVVADAWYLHHGRMPPGLMIEAGQADLLLISYLGADFANRGERVYRLLGCEVTFHGSPAKPGETLTYDIHIDGHAKHGDVRLFFFHSDCKAGSEKRLTVRGGQAGFFTDAELAASAGILWNPAETRPGEGKVAPPRVRGTRRSFSRAQVAAYSEGRVLECFGPGYERAETHLRTPRIPAGRLCLFDEVTHLDTEGGPWKRGYLRAVKKIAPDDWFFEGHFKNDPCMPGTLMFDGCLQTMAFYLTSLGHTLHRDGWRFEPIPDEQVSLRCRGQVTPASRELVYELFVEEVLDDGVPTLHADLLCTVDGLKAFHAKRMGFRLVRDVPLASPPAPRPGDERAAEKHGFRYDSRAIAAISLGRVSDALGPTFKPLDARFVAHMPNGPLQLIDRVLSVTGEPGVIESGIEVVCEVEIPKDAWYFAKNGSRVMPHVTLLEIALQPCGWLASYAGFAFTSPEDLLFRNLDGTGTYLAEVTPDVKVLTTWAKLTRVSKTPGMNILAFQLETRAGDRPVYRAETSFGFFLRQAFVNQPGLAATPADRAWLSEPSSFRVELGGAQARTPPLAGPGLLMLDRVTGFWPEGGPAGLGRLRAEKDVDPSEWFFKAHFFDDPVQPGSLGLEAMIQLLQWTMQEKDLGAGIPGARFEPIEIGRPITWKYRGQVVPENKKIVTEMNVLEVGRDERGPFARAEAWLWIDGSRAYHLKGFGVRIVAGAPAAPEGERVIDPEREPWVKDHRPTCTLPALALVDMAERIAQAAAPRHAGEKLVEIEGLEIKRFAVIDGPTRVRTQVSPAGPDADDVVFQTWREASTPALSRFEPAAQARLCFAAAYGPAPAPLPPLIAAVEVDDPYAQLFHGPAYRVVRRLWRGANGTSAILDAACAAPVGFLNHAMLDGIYHGLNPSLIHSLHPASAEGIFLPAGIDRLRLFAPAPSAGEVRCEVRLAEDDEQGSGLVRFVAQLSTAAGPWAEARFSMRPFPLPGAAELPTSTLVAFARGRAVGGYGFSRTDGDATRLGGRELRSYDWFPGTVPAIYGASARDTAGLTAEVAVKDHVARRTGAHPRQVIVDGDVAVAATRPFTRHAVAVEREGDEVVVRDVAPPRLELGPLLDFWRRVIGISDWPSEEIMVRVITALVRQVVVEDADGLAAIRGRGALFLGNHQVQIESILSSCLLAVLQDMPVVTIADARHKSGWVGRMVELLFSYPGVKAPSTIVYFDQEDRQSLLGINARLGELLKGNQASVMVHVEGKLGLTCRAPATTMSSLFVDLAVSSGAPIVPLRFTGGLPVEPLAATLDLPVGLGRQDYHLGGIISPEELRALPYADRKKRVLAAINATGPANAVEEPSPPNAKLAESVRARVAATGAPEAAALILALLEASPPRTPELRAVMEGSLHGASGWLASLATWLSGARAAR